MGRLLTSGPERQARLRAFLTLRLLPGVGDVAVQRLLEHFGTPQDALAASRKSFAAWTSGAAADARNRVDTRSDVDALLIRIDALKLTPCIFGLEGYPEGLRHLHDPPSLLFLKGDRALLERRVVAIVGARKASGKGRRVAAALAADLVAHDVVVLSGMALGIDSAAHRGALEAGGGTIAVLGSGLDLPYPPSNRGLFRQIGRDGLLVSEFLPGEGPLAHHFPRRNRIIAALSRCVVVAEAGQKSGALHTVRHALAIGREVYSLPGSAAISLSAGTNGLILDGSRVVSGASDIFDDLAWERPSADPSAAHVAFPEELGPDARCLWNELRGGTTHLDDLLERSGLSSARALAAISLLELSGWAIQEPGRHFAPRGTAASGRQAVDA